MEENSTRWLALREAGRRILVEENLTITVPSDYVEIWHRLILNMSDSMPQRVQFPLVKEGSLSVSNGQGSLFNFDSREPSDMALLWLPNEVPNFMDEVLQMCSELLLAGYPGCSGCGYREDETQWDEIAHRNRLKNSAK